MNIISPLDACHIAWDWLTTTQAERDASEFLSGYEFAATQLLFMTAEPNSINDLQSAITGIEDQADAVNKPFAAGVNTAIMDFVRISGCTLAPRQPNDYVGDKT